MSYKESSHYLRNIGHKNLAILDRHILKNLQQLNIISEIPKSLNKQKYLEIENKFKKFSEKINILSFNLKSERHFGEIKAYLEKTGNRLDDFDIMIASVAMSYNLTLIKNNINHFKRIPNLSIDNWI